MVRPSVLAVAALLLAASGADAEFYRWKDGDGREFYTNEREKIPAEYRSQARPVEVREDRVSVGSASAAPPLPDTKIAGHKDKNGRGESYWRKRAENLRREIRKMQGEQDIAARQIEEREQPGKKKNRKSTADLRKKKLRLEKDIARKQHELEVELPDEARKAEAYPGWLRE